MSRVTPIRCRIASLFLLLVTPSFIIPVWAAKNNPPGIPAPPDLLLEGGRKLSFERVFSSEREVLGKPKFWTRVFNAVAGEP
jgi:hypothetical protein